MSLDLRRYLDCAATTPVAPEVQAEIQRVEREAWANPSSLHGFGLAAAEQLDRSRDQIASLLGCSGQVVFTSGGSNPSTSRFSEAPARSLTSRAPRHGCCSPPWNIPPAKRLRCSCNAWAGRWSEFLLIARG